MDFRIIKTVIAREYSTRVKKKSFLVTTFLVPILFAAMMVVVMYIMGNTKERKQDVAVVDQSGIVMPHLTDTERITYEDYSSEAPDDTFSQVTSTLPGSFRSPSVGSSRIIRSGPKPSILA